MPAIDLAFYLSDSDSPAKRAILKSALALFAARGVAGVSIRDIAAAAGFSNPAMFRHFESKDALARTLFEACYRRLAQALTQPNPGEEAGLKGRVGAALEMIAQSPDSVCYVLDNLSRYWRDLPADARRSSLPGLMRGLIEREQAAGRLRADVDPRLAAGVVLGVLAQFARLAQFDELRQPAPRLAAALWDILAHGLEA